MSKEKETKKLSRRNFLKFSTAAGVGTTLVGLNTLSDPKKSTAYAFDLMVKEHDDMPYEISPDYKRFDQKYTIFLRAATGAAPNAPAADKVLTDIANKYYPVSNCISPAPVEGVGWSLVDNALAYAGWSVHKTAVVGKGTSLPNVGLYSWEGDVNERKVNFESPKEAAKIVKKAAKTLGADLVGIAPYDERWIYSHTLDPKTKQSVPYEFPFKPKSVIAMAVEMDYDLVKASPAILGDAATGIGYSQMAETAHKVATFLRKMGYNAIPSGNDTGLSVPIAIQAGLGELSRMGMLVTKEYGPRVRLFKVLTDLEIKTDKPISFGVMDFCKVCMKCADNCPSDCISKDDEPSFNYPTISNHAGVKKWYIDGEKCFKFWGDNGGCCGACIATCPYNKIDEWHHDLAKLATVAPGLKSIAREFDEMFGYGKTYNEKAVTDFWESE